MRSFSRQPRQGRQSSSKTESSRRRLTQTDVEVFDVAVCGLLDLRVDDVRHLSHTWLGLQCRLTLDSVPVLSTLSTLPQ